MRRRRSRPGRLRLEPLEGRVCLSGVPADPAAVQMIDWEGRAAAALRDAWIVRAAPDKAGLDAATFRATLGTSGWTSRDLGQGFFAVSTPGVATADVLAWASATPGVVSIEPDFVITSQTIPNDPSFGQLWGLRNTGQSGGVRGADIGATDAWEITTGSRDVVVAVVDTGIDYTHPDLAANVWRNPRETPGNGIDDDGNGYVDDVHGWDFANDDNNPFDDNGHGTHVAGTIGAVGNNGRGVTGVNWQVSIMALKFLSGSGSGSTSDAIAAINYATRMRRDFGIDVVATNNSWGGGGFSTALRDAIQAGGNAGILFVAAAGNASGDNDATPSYPASYPGTAIISVAATNRSNQLAGFSNYGATSVDVAAPGESVYSTTPNNTYATYSGTSMATPHVTGVAALLAAAAPRATASQIRAAILAGTTPVAAFAGKVATGGLLNAAGALRELVGNSILRADIADVDPDPRFGAVPAVVIEFNRPVAGLDLSDLRLTRDGSSVPLVDAAITADAGNTSRWTLSGLGGLTSTVGRYTLTLVAAGSGIADAGSTPLAADATENWQVIPPPPPAPGEPNDSLATAVPVGLAGGTATVTGFVGNGPHGAADVDMFAVPLVAGSVLSVAVAARSLPAGSNLDSYVRIFDAAGRMLAFNDDAGGSLDSRLDFAVPAGGTYFVGLSAYGNSAYDPLAPGSGTAGYSAGEYAVTFAAILPPLVADIVDVTPDPRTTGVIAVTIRFNRPVTNFDAADLRLSRGGVPLPLDAATLSRSDDLIWSLGGLWDLTSTPGTYTLALQSSGSGIVDDQGVPLSASAADSWTVTSPGVAVDAGDTIRRAVRIDPTTAARTGVRLAGRVGDGQQGRRDVDFYRIELRRGQTIVVDVDAASLPVKSSLDSCLRLFNASGTQLASNDDDAGSVDSLVSFTARATGTYYVGISGAGNVAYTPTAAGSGRNGSTGGYEIAFSIPAAPQGGSTVTMMGFADGPTQAAFATLVQDWLGTPPGRRAKR